MTSHVAQPSTPPRPSRRRRFVIGFLVSLGVVGLAAALALAYIAHAYASAIPAHVTVAGVDLGGLNEAAAQLKLQAAVTAANASAITITVNGTAITRAATDLKIQYAVPATVTAALGIGRTAQPVVTAWHQLTRLFAQPLTVPLQVSYDQTALAAAVAELSDQLGTPTTDTHLVVGAKGALGVSDTKAGQAIDVGPLADQLSQQLASLTIERRLIGQLTEHQPSVSTADAHSLLPLLGRLMPATTLSLTVDSGPVTTVDLKTLASWIVFAPVTADLDANLTLFMAPRANDQPGSVAAVLNRAVVVSYVKTLATRLDQPAVDAKLTIQDGRATIFQASRVGRRVKQAEAVNAVISALVGRAQNLGDGNQNPEPRIQNPGSQTAKPVAQNSEFQSQNSAIAISLPVETTQAAITDSTISSLGINQLIGQGTTDFSGSPDNRVHNIGMGARSLSGVIVKPGDEFSTVGSLGAIDASTGYLPELVILNNKILPQYGGGLCQVSTTLFRSVLNAGLPVTERAPHSLQVIYYQRGVGPGLDATVYDPKPDFKFKNDTPGSILVQAHIDGNMLTFELYGTSDGRVSHIDGPHTLATSASPADQYQTDSSLQPGEKKTLEHAVPGATTIATYTVVRDGREINRQVFSSKYSAMPNIYAVGPDKSEGQ